MKEEIEMEGYNQIYEFMEGLLDPPAEPDMFYMLASNEELRSEFRRLVKFDKSLHNNRNLLEVPDGSQKSLFASLGIPLTPEHDKEKEKNFFWTNFNFKKVLPFVITALASSILTILLLMLVGKPDYASENSKQMQKYYQEVSFLKNELAKKNSNTNQVPAVVRDTVIKKQVVYKTTPIIQRQEQSNQLNYNTLAASNTELYDYTKKIPAISIPGNFNRIVVDNSQFNFSQPLILFQNENDTDPAIDSKRLEFILGGTQYWSLPASTITPKEFGAFMNMQIGVRYRLNNAFKVGADIRRETFFQKFNGLDGLGQYTVYEQQPNFTTYSLGLQYYPVDMGNFHPYLVTSLGGNAVGYVWRGGGGITYIVGNSIAFEIGVDYSTMYYNFDQNWFNSSKLGINYGISYYIR